MVGDFDEAIVAIPGHQGPAPLRRAGLSPASRHRQPDRLEQLYDQSLVRLPGSVQGLRSTILLKQDRPLRPCPPKAAKQRPPGSRSPADQYAVTGLRMAVGAVPASETNGRTSVPNAADADGPRFCGSGFVKQRTRRLRGNADGPRWASPRPVGSEERRVPLRRRSTPRKQRARRQAPHGDTCRGMRN